MNQKTNPQPSQDWKYLVAEFQNTSDRSVAILGVSYLRNHLGRLLGCFMINDPTLVAELFDPENILSGFGVRIHLAHALGLISSNEHHDLTQINKIYTAFLNDLDSAKFSDEDIRLHCYSLKIPREVLLPEETPIPRRLFVFAVALLVGQLTLRASQAEDERRTPPDNFMLVDVER